MPSMITSTQWAFAGITTYINCHLCFFFCKIYLHIVCAFLVFHILISKSTLNLWIFTTCNISWKYFPPASICLFIVVFLPSYSCSFHADWYIKHFLNACNLMSLDISKHLWKHCNNHSINTPISPKFSPMFVLIVILCLIRALNIQSTLLANFYHELLTGHHGV